ncbi:MAG: RIP metalloprotease RseP [Streptococcaceae bacterium]|nr:RIP metalloprotease RseP [Streptococcaceae bacterium]
MRTIITFILVFAVIVIVHEFGHFYFAKKSGVLVREFAIGMGPKIFYHRGKDGTAYTIRILPVGGYVRMAGMDDDDGEITPGETVSLILDEQEIVQRINMSSKKQLPNSVPMEVEAVDLIDDLFIRGYIHGDDGKTVEYKVNHEATVIENDGTEVRIAPRDVQLQSAKVTQRMMTNFAGPMNNFILGVIVFIIVIFMRGGVSVDNTNRIGAVQENSPAYRAGLKENDEIVSINGDKITNWDDLVGHILPNPDKELTMEVISGGNEKTIKVTPKQAEGVDKTNGIIGIGQPVDSSILAMFFGGFKQAFGLSVAIFQGIINLILRPSLDQLGGPVMIFHMSEQASQSGFSTVLLMLGMLSMNLGMANLMPIPALDGGKIVLNIIEAIRRKPLSPEKEGVITLIGAGFMVILMILVTWNDIQRFFIR